MLTFDQDELGVPYSSQSSQVNSPRLLLQPDSQTKKKKKNSPKPVKMDIENETVSRPVISSTQPLLNAEIVPPNDAPVESGPTKNTVISHNNDDTSVANICTDASLPDTRESLGEGVNEPLSPKSRSLPTTTDPNNHVISETCDTPKRHDGFEVSQKTLLENKHVTASVPETDSGKRFSPTKVEEVLKNRGTVQTMTVIEVNDSSSDCSNKPAPKQTVKPPRRIALTKIE